MNEVKFSEMLPGRYSPQAIAEAFDREYGNDAILIAGMLVFSSGAQRDADPRGILLEPPENDHERAEIVVDYWEAKLERATEAFKELKHTYVDHSKGALSEPLSPAPYEDKEEAVKKLRALQVTVKRYQIKCREAREQFKATAPKAHGAAVRAETKQRSETNRKKNREFLTAISEVKI